MANSIEIINLNKNFITFKSLWLEKKITPALSGINLTIEEGKCFVLLGTNGAGKTTLIKILSGLILPDTGEIKIAGYNLESQEKIAKSKIGLVTGEERGFYWRLTGRQNLEFFATLYNISFRLAEKKINELGEIFNIHTQLNNRFQEYSTGTKQKLAIIKSLLNDPAIILMDEPTKSLDPRVAKNLRNFIKTELVIRQKKTVLLATHNISEAETISDQIAILDKGHIKIVDSPNEALYDVFLKSTT